MEKNIEKLKIQLENEEKAKVALEKTLQNEKNTTTKLKLQLQEESQKLKDLDEKYIKVNASNEKLTLEAPKLKR